MTEEDDPDPWYETWAGVAAVGGYVVVAAALAAATTAGVSLVAPVAAALAWAPLPAVELPRIGVVVPLDVYRFAVLGALTRFVLSFDARIPRFGDDAGEPTDQSESDRFAKHVIGVFAAPPLAAGVFLGFAAAAGSPEPGGNGAAAAAFVVGVFTRGAHRALGDLADQLLDPVEETDARRVSLAGRVRSATLALGALGLVAWSAVESGSVAWICPSVCAPIPADVYAYGLLGGTGYVFTALLNAPDKPASWLGRATLRVFAGTTLAAGVYLAVTPAGPVVALVAYLAGLYTNAAVGRLAAFGGALFNRFERFDGE